MLCLSFELMKVFCTEDGGGDRRCSRRTLIVLVEDAAMEGLHEVGMRNALEGYPLTCCQGWLVKEHT